MTRNTRKSRRFWDFVGDNLLSLTTVFAGLLVALLSSLNMVTPQLSIVTILGLLSLLATTELVDKSRKLNKIEDLLDQGIADLRQDILSLEGMYVQAWTSSETDKYLLYLQTRFREATDSIDHAALSPPLPRWFPEMAGYEQSIETLVKTNVVRYRYIACFTDPARVQRVRRHLTNPNVKRYFVGFFSFDPEKIPLISFSIIDEAEVLFYFPTPLGESEAWISIRHKGVAQAFSSYFRRLWELSTKVTPDLLNSPPFSQQEGKS